MRQPLLKVDEQLELYAPDPDFAEEVYRILQAQREHLQPWLPWLDHARSIAHVRRLLHDLDAFNQGGQRFTTFIFHDQNLCGSIGLPRIDHRHRRAEMGYWLRSEFQGQGMVTRSCRALIRHAFLQLQLNRLEIHVPSDNKRSLRIPRRLNFRHEGTLRQHTRLNNTFLDMEVFSLLKEEWKANAPESS